MPDQTASSLFQAFSDNLEGLMMHASSDITFWFNINLAITIAVVILGVGATLLTSLQTSTNQQRLKPLAVIAAVLLTSVSSLSNVFHTQDNLKVSADTFVKTKELKYNFDAARLDPTKTANAAQFLSDYNRQYAAISTQFMTAFTYFAPTSAAPPKEQGPEPTPNQSAK